MSRIIFPVGIEHPIVSREEYIIQQQKCSLLTDVGSQMAKDWENEGGPGNGFGKWNDIFSWTPTNQCGADVNTTGAKFEDFIISSNPNDLIFTLYRGVLGVVTIAPAAFIAFEKTKPDTAYIVFRGTLGITDVGIDVSVKLVQNPIVPDDVDGGKTHEGFSKYFAGLGIDEDGSRLNAGQHQGDGYLYPKPQGKTLYQTLHDLVNVSGVKHLVVTGHSLGSAVATLVASQAVYWDIFQTVVGSVSASPKVASPEFKTWFDKQFDKDNRKLKHRFWKLTNTEDSVPKSPGANLGYTDVGIDVTFAEEYSSLSVPDDLGGQSAGETITAGSFIFDSFDYSLGFKYKIKTVGTTDFTACGSEDNEIGTVFIATSAGSGTGDAVVVDLIQANPNHNPCCCYGYAINHPDFTRNAKLNNADNPKGTDCAFPVTPPPPIIPPSS